MHLRRAVGLGRDEDGDGGQQQLEHHLEGLPVRHAVALVQEPQPGDDLRLLCAHTTVVMSRNSSKGVHMMP